MNHENSRVNFRVLQRRLRFENSIRHISMEAIIMDKLSYLRQTIYDKRDAY